MRNENNELIKDSNCKISINQEIDYDVVICKLENPDVVLEGYIFTRVDENNNNILCKVIHPSYYDKMKFNPGFKTIQEQYIHLFQKNLLKQYIENNPYSKVSSTGENIELVGLVTYIFKFVGQRMLDIYYKFNNNNMVHRNEDLFRKSFLENKDYSLIFYTLGMMKGIHKNKQLNIKSLQKTLFR